MSLKKGDIIQIHCYKHDGTLHKVWDKSVVLENKKDCLIVANENVLVTNFDGKSWRTKECAILFFYKNRWFNIIAQFKKFGLYYYCNICSPFVIDGNILKYIDYDLDLRVFNNGSFRVLDRDEYETNRRKMKYPFEIVKIISKELNNLINMKKKGVDPFNFNYVNFYYNLYKKM